MVLAEPFPEELLLRGRLDEYPHERDGPEEGQKKESGVFKDSQWWKISPPTLFFAYVPFGPFLITPERRLSAPRYPPHAREERVLTRRWPASGRRG